LVEELMRDESRSGDPGRHVERLLAEGRKHSLRDVARQTGLDADYILRNHTAMGLPRPSIPDEPIYDDAILANAEIMATLLEAGLTESDLTGLSRVMGVTARRMAEALVDVFAVRPKRSLVRRRGSFRSARRPCSRASLDPASAARVPRRRSAHPASNCATDSASAASDAKRSIGSSGGR
jgi:hypothetical protein